MHLLVPIAARNRPRGHSTPGSGGYSVRTDSGWSTTRRVEAGGSTSYDQLTSAVSATRRRRSYAAPLSASHAQRERQPSALAAVHLHGPTTPVCRRPHLPTPGDARPRLRPEALRMRDGRVVDDLDRTSRTGRHSHGQRGVVIRTDDRRERRLAHCRIPVRGEKKGGGDTSHDAPRSQPPDLPTCRVRLQVLPQAPGRSSPRRRCVPCPCARVLSCLARGSSQHVR